MKEDRTIFVLVVLWCGFLFWASRDPTPAAAAVEFRQASGRQTATDEALRSPEPLRPDAKLTPGVRNPKITQANIKTTICVVGFTAKERGGEVETTPGDKGVTAGEKEEVYAAYGVLRRLPKQYEIDHLISLELGGANAKENLWPQAYERADGSPWNAHVKDRLENRLKTLVCAGNLTLSDAQECISSDWVACYQKTYGVKTP